MSIIASAKLGTRLLRVLAYSSSLGSCSFVEDLPEAMSAHWVALFAEQSGSRPSKVHRCPVMTISGAHNFDL